MIDITEDTITIYDDNFSKDEIVRWLKDEWIEDPDVVLSIANAIRIYYEKGPCALKKLIGK